ncbi:sugar ABC transporter permease, partial [Bacillus safensis]|nr:sugar ABC transporter permease [Bacillus safensis]
MNDITKAKQPAAFTSLPKQKIQKRQNSSLWWMYMPAVLVVSTFIIYPFLNGIQLSFTNWNGF